MAIILLRTDKSRLWEEGPVVVAAGIFFAVGLPGDIAVFVTAHALFAGPQWEWFTAQIEVRELFAAAVDMIVWVSGQTQPDAVVAAFLVMKVELQTPLFVGGDVQRGVDGIATAEIYPPAVRRLANRGVGQRNFLIELIFNTEVAAEHINVGNASADPQARGLCAVT
ncbi:hypothetical protein CIT292_08838 [Citrobacter youngae ATCC 29220]|uniref:Uncharacterized protein n=1 Tax=Citrobacter youngae ATCC 29220 TaxID=500640 RepID=D4BEA5_9ENTR|nr:hypothetical protein CIT292_08838 [Citrobacter youngae ATCC 29220]